MPLEPRSAFIERSKGRRDMEVSRGALVLALDFGGTKLAAGVVVGETGEVITRRSRPTRGDLGAAGSIEDMLALATDVCGMAGLPVSAVTGAGVSFGGPVDADRGTVLLSHHVPGWENLPLAAVLAERLEVPVVVENDANAQALGEWRYGAGRGASSLLNLNIGTGIGGGIVLDGTIYRGAHGLAGEIGHTIVQPNGPICTCGKRGCLEAIAAGPGIARRAAAALRDARDRAPKLARLADLDAEMVPAHLVFQAAADGDAVAQEIVAETVFYLAVGLANAINTIDPAVVTIGGGVTRAGEQLFAPLRAAVTAICAPADPKAIRILPSLLGDDVGILGAAALLEKS